MAHKNTGNSNAKKPAGNKAEGFLHVRVKTIDKARWIRAAKGEKLSQWIIKTLNSAAKGGNE